MRRIVHGLLARPRRRYCAGRCVAVRAPRARDPALLAEGGSCGTRAPARLRSIARQLGESIALGTTGAARQSSSKPRPRLLCSGASTGSKPAPDPARALAGEATRRGIKSAVEQKITGEQQKTTQSVLGNRRRGQGYRFSFKQVPFGAYALKLGDLFSVVPICTVSTTLNMRLLRRLRLLRIDIAMRRGCELQAVFALQMVTAYPAWAQPMTCACTVHCAWNASQNSGTSRVSERD